MKFLPPLVLALLTAACVAPPPQPGTAAHQRLLAEQARENFYALKEQQRKSRAPVIARATPPAPPAEKRGLLTGLFEKPATATDTTVYEQRRTAAPVKPAKLVKLATPTPAPARRAVAGKPPKTIAKAPEPTKRTAFGRPRPPAQPIARAPEPAKRTAFAKPPKSAKPAASATEPTKRTVFGRPPKAARPVAKAPEPPTRTAGRAKDEGIVMKDGVRGRWVKVATPAKPIAKAPVQKKRTTSAKPLASGQPATSRSLFKPSETARLAKTKRSDETVYYHEGRNAPEPNSARYRAHKRKFAQSLGKTPETLTRKELERARMNYRN